MANWLTEPALTQTYAAFVSSIRARDEDVARAFDGVGTNPPDGAFKFDSGAASFFVYSSASTAWNRAASVFQITASAAQFATSATNANHAGSATYARAAASALYAHQASVATANTSTLGKIEIATSAEVSALTDTSRAVTPAGLIALFGAVVSSYSRTTGAHIHSDSGHATGFDIDAAIGAAWESVGPTGSGATNTWTALNNVPTDAKAIIVRMQNSATGASTSTSYGSFIYSRVTGSSTGLVGNAEINGTSFYNHSGVSETSRNYGTVILPIDSSRRFDLYMTTIGGGVTVAASMYLQGWLQ